MARAAQRLAENAPGAFFVDDSCIDCDACRQIAPATFVRSPRHGMSYVAAQPTDADGERRARMAIVACPTASIGTSPKRPVGDAVRAFPERLLGPRPKAGARAAGDEIDDVWYCGWHAADSYGAASYLIVRPDRGNILVDSPRASRALHERIAALGGVATMVLSHRDDVADHEWWHARFGCTRVMHAADAGRLPIEHLISGTDPVALDDELTLIPVPGHTRGSIALLYREKFLFTGDHLWWDEDVERLDMGRGVCWYDWREQLRSLEKLRAFRFEWVLPGHGRRWRAQSAADMQRAVEHALENISRR